MRLRVALVLALCFGELVTGADLVAQEVSFTPRMDAIDDNPRQKRPKSVVETPVVTPKPQAVYSFARFAPKLKLVCERLRVEGRNQRVYDVAKQALAEDQDCASCRALYRQFVLLCETKVDRSAKPLTPTPTVAPSATPDLKAGEFNPLSKFDGKDDNTPTPTVTPTPEPPQPVRYPSTELIDVLSRLSAEMYDFEPGSGSTFVALKAVVDRLLQVNGLTPGERDYFSVFGGFMLAAWEGRPESPLEVAPVSPTEVAELFQ